MITLGIDPGTATMGYGVVERRNDEFLCLEYGIISTEKGHSPSYRLHVLSENISSLIEKYSPAMLAIENVYFFKNIKTVIPVSQAKGAIMATAEKENVPVREFTPLQIKMAITGYGKADKAQVQEMIKITLNLEKKPSPNDAADALGAAISGILEKESPLSSLDEEGEN